MLNGKYSLFDHKLNVYLTYGIILFIIFAISVYKVALRSKNDVMTSIITTYFIISVFLVIVTFCEIVLRLCQIGILLIDVDQQLIGDFWSIVSHRFTLNIASAITVVTGVLLFLSLLITIRRCPFNYMWDFGPYICILSMIFAILLLRITSLKEQEIQSSALDTLQGLDYGTGLAYSYYYGYLRIILPSTGTTSKGLIEKIENFEDNHNISFRARKLFILIPSSSYIPPDLKEASYQWMENARELEEEKRDRAGNKGRKYRSNVYKIYPGGPNSGITPEYVVAEGASPLLTFYEVQNHTHPESNIYKQYKKEIIMKFYTKLQEILQSELDTKDLCELIYYDDYEPNGIKVNIAKLILERL